MINIPPQLASETEKSKGSGSAKCWLQLEVTSASWQRKMSSVFAPASTTKFSNHFRQKSLWGTCWIQHHIPRHQGGLFFTWASGNRLTDLSPPGNPGGPWTQVQPHYLWQSRSPGDSQSPVFREHLWSIGFQGDIPVLWAQNINNKQTNKTQVCTHWRR